MLTLQPLPHFRFNINDVVPRGKRGDERCQRFNELINGLFLCVNLRYLRKNAITAQSLSCY